MKRYSTLPRAQEWEPLYQMYLLIMLQKTFEKNQKSLMALRKFAEIYFWGKSLFKNKQNILRAIQNKYNE